MLLRLPVAEPLCRYLQQALGYSPIETGLAVMPMVAGLMITSTLATTVLMPRIGPKPVVPLGMGLAAANMVWLTGLDLTSTYATDIMPALIVAGLVMAPAMSLATSGVAAEDSGVASATVAPCSRWRPPRRSAAQHPLNQRTHRLHDRKEPEGPGLRCPGRLEGYSTAYWWCAVFFAIGLGGSVVLYRRGVPAQDEHRAPAVHM
ncbi:hypothetical protein [Streptomyces huasconensis]|uniref:hypothetical protein n=1 Tax=Streptomyces huasconensis TaxID=1854574 RepID=UPI0033DCE890